MTQFMKKIRMVETGRHKAVIPNVEATFDLKDQPHHVVHERDTEVNFTFEYHAWAWVPSNGQAMECARRDMLEKFRREVYGEVENDLYCMLESLYHNDNRDAMQKCQRLMHKLQEI